MENNKASTFAEGRDLVLVCLINAPREKLFKAWTDPSLIKQWFAPAPYSFTKAEVDARVGGSSVITMRSRDGREFPGSGVFLEVVENERLVFTDAYVKAWEPSQKPFMTVILTFEDDGGKTKYTATVRHWSLEDREAHEAMGFHQGWAICAEQLAKLVEG